MMLQHFREHIQHINSKSAINRINIPHIYSNID